MKGAICESVNVVRQRFSAIYFLDPAFKRIKNKGQELTLGPKEIL